MRTLTAITILSLLTLGLQAQTYTKPSSSSIGFKIKNFGSYMDGSFKTVTIDAVFDANNANNISLRGVAKVSSISTGNNLRNKHLREKEEFFNEAKTPTVTMESYKVEKISSTKYKVYWKITMRGVTKNISATMDVKSVSGGVALSTRFSVDRNLWSLGGNGFKMSAVGDDVIVSISTILK